MRATGQRPALPVLHGPPPADGAGELERAGWTRRFVASPPRLEEMVTLYRSLGFEVREEPLDACELDDDCADCVTVGAAPRVVYTRRPQ